jgi:hypothetical protein
MVELKAAAQPLVPQVQAAWRSAPSKTRKSRSRRGQPDLRQLLAKSTWVQARLTGKQAGVSVRTDGRRMPSGSKSLPGYAEGVRRRPWRHPVYGDRDTWRNQQPFPRFYDAARPDAAMARRRVNAAFVKVFDEIKRAR